MATVDAQVLVIGAGIQGAGVAQAAAAAGHSVIVLERRAPAAGTSSRSSKLIHGGLRYLESLQFRLVAESLRERSILLKIAPHLVNLRPFFIPVYPDTTRRPWELRIGLSLYAVLARFAPGTGFGCVPREEWQDLDGLCTRDLQQVFRYCDGQTDDAGLCRAVLASAVALGAEVRVPAEVVDARRCEGGWALRYREGDTEHQVRARLVINAAGPWANRVLERFEAPGPVRAVELVAGSHVEIEGEVVRGIYYLEAPQDRRAVFVMPWKGRTLVGTTEVSFQGDPDQLKPSEAEIEYLLEVFRHYFPRRSQRVIDSWAGLRVLPQNGAPAFRRSREVMLCADDARRPSLLTIYGGKLTGYRATAQRVLERCRGSLSPVRAVADTRTLRLPDGGQVIPRAEPGTVRDAASHTVPR